MTPVSLCRLLSKAGIASRTRAADLIRSGRVCVNGRVITDPESRFNGTRSRIDLDGVRVRRAEHLALMMNKPAGFVTTASDERGRKTVYDLLPDQADSVWLAPVGRLDRDSEELLLFTNDTLWAAGITDPDSSVLKTYHVRIDRIPSPALLDRLVSGIFDRGELLRAEKASPLRSGTKNSWIEIVLAEGKNRQIRRMLQSLDLRVLRLIRVAVGPLKLGALPKGSTRPLTARETASLRQDRKKT